MLKAKFYLKDTKNAESLIICVVFQRSQKLLTVSTGIKTKSHDWNSKKQEFKPSSPISKEGNNVINNLRRKVIDLSIRAVKFDTIDELKQFVKIEIIGETKSNKNISFYDCFKLYYAEKLIKQAEGTNKVYKALPQKIKSFEQSTGVKITFNYWNVDSLKLFSAYLYNSGYLNDTVSNNIKALKAFLNWSYETYHNNQSYKSFAVKWENHNVINLSANELQRLYEFDLSTNKRLEKVRDLFCIGVYTTQRYSDLRQLTPSQIEGNYWILNSEKTRKLLKIPLNSKTCSILKKYNYSPAPMSNQKFNKALKEVGKIVGIDSPVQKVSYSGIKRIIVNAPKYEFLSSHTARRTGITLLIENGVPLPMIQRITGHCNIMTLLKYDGTTINNLFPYLEQL